MRTPAILCLVLLVALAGCGGNGGGEAEEAPQAEATPAPQGEQAAPADTTSMTIEWKLDDVAGMSWILDSLVLEGETIELDPQVDSTFRYDEGGKVTGSGGCNRFNGSVTRDAATGTISFSPLATTKMACEGMADVQETAYLNALAKVEVVKLHGHGLTLASQDGSTVLGFRLLLESE
jgi:heat shock protein HslJ